METSTTSDFLVEAAAQNVRDVIMSMGQGSRAVVPMPALPPAAGGKIPNSSPP